MNMKSATQLMIGLLAALSLSAAALAGEHGSVELTEEQKELKAILDTNGDGVISESEAQQYPELAARFRELDQNGDGVIEPAEFARFEVTEQDLEQIDDDFMQ